MNDRIVPPRPNLGPEPWDDHAAVDWIIAIIFVIFIMNFFFYCYQMFLDLKNVRRLKRESAADESANDDPKAVWVAWSNRVRAALDLEFGASHSARTTEEIEADPAIKSGLSAERRDRLIAFLREADLAKFAGESIALDAETISAWETWVVEFCRDSQSPPRPKTPKPNRIDPPRLAQLFP